MEVSNFEEYASFPRLSDTVRCLAFQAPNRLFCGTQVFFI